jgi:hypothetical protein
VSAAGHAQLADRLALQGPAVLGELGHERVLAAWDRAVELFRDPLSTERRALDPRLASACALSPQGVAAGLEAVLWGVRRAPAQRLLAAARVANGASSRGLTLVVLAANLPGLAVQPLLRGLARGDAVLLKSASAEPCFAPAFVAALTAFEPALGDCVAAVTWPGGDLEIEPPLLERARRVEVFGGDDAVRSWRGRAGDRLKAYGPRLSVGIVARGADLAAAAAGLARDIALFDQRGCLSPQAILVEENADRLAAELAAALTAIAREIPAGAALATDLAAVQQVRAEAEMRGLTAPVMAIDDGTVIVETGAALEPSPGRRTVRLYTLGSMDSLAARLAPWRGRIQGAALCGELSEGAHETLRELDVTRLAPAGELQRPEADWDGADRALALSA